ncbi:MAG: primosomal protein N' [Xanthomonadales bacterium]|jgi:primosomal protein N' (replication factor Y)|nr:primosomal protein N' [Xanthomonadales bacterium]
MPTLLRIATATPLPELLDYLLPADLSVVPGQRVRVSVGRRAALGLVVEAVEVDEASLLGGRRLKPIEAVLDATAWLSAELLELGRFLSAYYQHPPGPCYLQLLPAALRQPGEVALPRHEQLRRSAAPISGRLTADQQRLLQLLAECPQPAAVIAEQLPRWRPVAQQLARRGLLYVESVAPFRAAAGPALELQLNAEQSAAVDAVLPGGRIEARAFLLDGVTGSGKTEVYLESIRQVLAAGRQALYLVPEIGLTPQLIDRVRRRLPARIAVIHSQLSDGERCQAWMAAAAGELDVLIGTRSALFAPFPRLGIIVIDEEHDSSYKQAEQVRFHARDLALLRGRNLGIPVLLGSATPALETLRNVEAGRLTRLTLTRPALAARPPDIELIDLNQWLPVEGLAEPTLTAIGETLSTGGQVLVFRNQRGYSRALMCLDCRWHSGCPECSATLTWHRGLGLLLCHHCGHQTALPSTCPACSSRRLRPVGEGTERLEEGLSTRFPGVPVLRVDRDSTQRKGSFAELLAVPLAGKPCILVGTQMLAKGHHLPQIALVVVASVDGSLYSADLRAPERLAQLLTQVAGRAGRAERAGKVLVQTRRPEHPLLRLVLSAGYAAAAHWLLEERRLARLPPWTHDAILLVDARDTESLQSFLAAADAAWLALDPQGVESSGPIPAPMQRRAGRWRGQIVLNASNRSRLQALLGQWRRALYALKAAGVHWVLDVDPLQHG